MMQELLFLVHRIPYPPNKGDKIRSYHMLKHLSQRYRVHLGTFVDDERDWEYLDKVKLLCGETCFVKLDPMTSRMRSLSGMLSNSPLSLPYYRNASLQAWVDAQLGIRPIKNILVFSSVMAQYVRKQRSARRVIDFVDIDSDKWKQYAITKPWPLNWLYQRESRLLLTYEREVAKEFDGATFVSEAEADFFKQLAPEAENKITYFNNGVDTSYFSPQAAFTNPYPPGTVALVFTGAMDYWANADAVEWFSKTVFPEIHAQFPRVKFYIVGARPTSRVNALATLPGITVTGTVPDVRPFLAHAALAVAPLRIARGIQNKVLEAMAMEIPVLASPQALEGIRADIGRELFVASDDRDFIRQIVTVLQSGSSASMGKAARSRILKDYSWPNSLARLDKLLSEPQLAAAEKSPFPRKNNQENAALGNVV
ncbi:MAG: TIGR03087 family PEP-CTERM/XrtA system glycosyltransferase [Oxalobacteraceae bacterium]